MSLSDRVAREPIQHAPYHKLRGRPRRSRLFGAQVGCPLRKVRKHSAGMNSLTRSDKLVGSEACAVVKDRGLLPGSGT